VVELEDWNVRKFNDPDFHGFMPQFLHLVDVVRVSLRYFVSKLVPPLVFPVVEVNLVTTRNVY
jgi:hypothetical protein